MSSDEEPCQENEEEEYDHDAVENESEELLSNEREELRESEDEKDVNDNDYLVEEEESQDAHPIKSNKEEGQDDDDHRNIDDRLNKYPVDVNDENKSECGEDELHNIATEDENLEEEIKSQENQQQTLSTKSSITEKVTNPCKDDEQYNVEDDHEHEDHTDYIDFGVRETELIYESEEEFSEEDNVEAEENEANKLLPIEEEKETLNRLKDQGGNQIDQLVADPSKEEEIVEKKNKHKEKEKFVGQKDESSKFQEAPIKKKNSVFSRISFSKDEPKEKEENMERNDETKKKELNMEKEDKLKIKEDSQKNKKGNVLTRISFPNEEIKEKEISMEQKAEPKRNEKNMKKNDVPMKEDSPNKKRDSILSRLGPPVKRKDKQDLSGNDCDDAEKMKIKKSRSNNDDGNDKPKIPGMCIDYNSKGICRDAQCKWGHRCEECGGDHPKCKCTQRKPKNSFSMKEKKTLMEMGREEKKKDGYEKQNCTLFIKSKSFDSITEEDLKEFFGMFGKVISCYIPRRQNGKKRNFGFIGFENYNEAEKAVKETGILTIKGNIITIKIDTKSEGLTDIKMKEGKRNDNDFKQGDVSSYVNSRGIPENVDLRDLMRNQISDRLPSVNASPVSGFPQQQTGMMQQMNPCPPILPAVAPLYQMNAHTVPTMQPPYSRGLLGSSPSVPSPAPGILGVAPPVRGSAPLSGVPLLHDTASDFTPIPMAVESDDEAPVDINIAKSKLFIGNLPEGISEEVMRKILNMCGEVCELECEVIDNRIQSCCTVTFKKVVSVYHAFRHLNGMNIFGKKIIATIPLKDVHAENESISSYNKSDQSIIQMIIDNYISGLKSSRRSRSRSPRNDDWRYGRQRNRSRSPSKDDLPMFGRQRNRSRSPFNNEKIMYGRQRDRSRSPFNEDRAMHERQSDRYHLESPKYDSSSRYTGNYQESLYPKKSVTGREFVILNLNQEIGECLLLPMLKECYQITHYMNQRGQFVLKFGDEEIAVLLAKVLNGIRFPDRYLLVDNSDSILQTNVNDKKVKVMEYFIKDGFKSNQHNFILFWQSLSKSSEDAWMDYIMMANWRDTYVAGLGKTCQILVESIMKLYQHRINAQANDGISALVITPTTFVAQCLTSAVQPLALKYNQFVVTVTEEQFGTGGGSVVVGTASGIAEMIRNSSRDLRATLEVLILDDASRLLKEHMFQLQSIINVLTEIPISHSRMNLNKIAVVEAVNEQEVNQLSILLRCREQLYVEGSSPVVPHSSWNNQSSHLQNRPVVWEANASAIPQSYMGSQSGNLPNRSAAMEGNSSMVHHPSMKNQSSNNKKASSGPGTCNAFNNKGKCKPTKGSKPCKYSHKCSECGANHPKIRCKNNKQKGKEKDGRRNSGKNLDDGGRMNKMPRFGSDVSEPINKPSYNSPVKDAHSNIGAGFSRVSQGQASRPDVNQPGTSFQSSRRESWPSTKQGESSTIRESIGEVGRNQSSLYSRSNDMERRNEDGRSPSSLYTRSVEKASSHSNEAESNTYYGLDVKEIARVTLGKDTSIIRSLIKNYLKAQGVIPVPEIVQQIASAVSAEQTKADQNSSQELNLEEVGEELNEDDMRSTMSGSNQGTHYLSPKYRSGGNNQQASVKKPEDRLLLMSGTINQSSLPESGTWRQERPSDTWSNQQSSDTRRNQPSSGTWHQQRSSDTWSNQQSSETWSNQRSSDTWSNKQSSDTWGNQRPSDTWSNQRSSDTWDNQWPSDTWSNQRSSDSSHSWNNQQSRITKPEDKLLLMSGTIKKGSMPASDTWGSYGSHNREENSLRQQSTQQPRMPMTDTSSSSYGFRGMDNDNFSQRRNQESGFLKPDVAGGSYESMTNMLNRSYSSMEATSDRSYPATGRRESEVNKLLLMSGTLQQSGSLPLSDTSKRSFGSMPESNPQTGATGAWNSNINTKKKRNRTRSKKNSRRN